MVDFKTRIFTESDNDIIGAEVIVFSDQGTRIGSIEIANAEDLNALREELEVIDETYFDETRLNAVLANSQESTTINATSISGYSSSDLAKVSQLSGYALTNHTHVKTSITDLYNYSISCSNYNPTIDTDISVTVKVTNQAGNPVVGHTVSILKNNSSWKSGTTGSNGEFTTTYTCSEWGLITFSANNHNSTQILVEGFRQIFSNTTDNPKIIVEREGNKARLILLGYTANLATSFVQYGSTAFLSSVKPKQALLFVGYDDTFLLRVSEDGKLYWRSNTGSSQSNKNLYGQYDWSIA